MDVFVTTALAHPHCTSQLGHEQPVLCCWLCPCPFPQKGFMSENCFQASLKGYPCKSRFDPWMGTSTGGW